MFTSQSFVALLFVVSELNILPEAVCCCFTRTAFFTTLFIVVCSLKSMGIPSFIVVSVSYMVPIVLRLFIVVLQELQCLWNCLHDSIITVIAFYHFTKFCLSTP